MASNSSNGNDRKYHDLVAFVRRSGNSNAKAYPMVIGQMWRNNDGKAVFRIDAVPVGDRWDGSGVIEDHDERVERAKQKREGGNSRGRGDDLP